MTKAEVRQLARWKLAMIRGRPVIKSAAFLKFVGKLSQFEDEPALYVRHAQGRVRLPVSCPCCRAYQLRGGVKTDKGLLIECVICGTHFEISSES